MILDHRTYTFKPGQLAPFLKLYEPQALQIQISHLGNLVGYFISDIGPLNQAVHIWGYTSMQEREERREHPAAAEDGERGRQRHGSIQCEAGHRPGG